MGELDHIRVEKISMDDFGKHKHKKKKKRKKGLVLRALLVIFLLLFILSAIALFIILGRRDSVPVTEGASGAYVSQGEQFSENGLPAAEAEATPVPTPAPTPIPTPAPTPEPINNNPATGTEILRKYADQGSTVSVTNALSRDCCLIATHVTSETVAMIVFVRAGESCEFMVPIGTYDFSAKYGTEYVNEEIFFGSDTENVEIASGVSLPWGESVSLTVTG